MQSFPSHTAVQHVDYAMNSGLCSRSCNSLDHGFFLDFKSGGFLQNLELELPTTISVSVQLAA
jgi:hypothetical protein